MSEEDLVEERESVCDMPLGTFERVARADRATERRLLVSASAFLLDSRGADVGLYFGLFWPSVRESLNSCRYVNDDKDDARETRDDVCGEADAGERSSGVDELLCMPSGCWTAWTCGVEMVEILGVLDLLYTPDLSKALGVEKGGYIFCRRNDS